MPQSMGELEYDQQPRNQERSPKKKEKKWTLGSLFRRKKVKDSDSDSSDSDAVEEGKKGGFLARRRRRRAANRGSKDVSQSFEHVVLRPNAAPNVGTDVKKSVKARVEASRDSLLKDSSSEEECSPRTKARAPRSKRSSRDMTDCNMKVMELDSSPRSPRWTAKVVYCESSDYDARYTAHTRSATPSPAQSPIAKVKHLKRPPIPQSNVPRPLHCQKSASFDILPRQSQHYQHPPTTTHHNHHHHQLPQHHTRVPPPPPPRDPQRKIIPPSGYQLDRPLSYAFESNQPLPKIMTDHNSNITAYKVSSSCSLDHQPVYKMNSSGSLDHRRNYQYYTDQQPRSRKPIHIARVDQPYLSDSQIGRVRTSDWRLPRDSNSSLYDSSDSREGGTDVRPLSMVVETAEQQVQTQELPEKKELKRKSSNLEDALNELEAIYKTLQLRDEEPLLRGFESDSGCYRVVDDMAYRRLNRKDSRGSPDCRRVVSQAGSYLLVSPTLSPPPFATAPPIPPPQNEPDVTLDDVVYRNIRHTNNTLKVADPQPLFGIPIGPVAPAPSSDYLHAIPKQLYRPTFKPRKTPDIVKDDLAYRNLRKDGQHDSLLSTEECLLNENPSILKKKRAVRSLSANLLSIIQKEQFRIENQNMKNFNYDTDNFEKTQSYSDLPDVIDTRYKRSYSTEDSDVTPRVSRMYPDIPISTTSTETLTDSRANIMNAQESCSSKNQYLPFTYKPLPKTDFAKLRLPSPNVHQISSPKKFVYGDTSACIQNNAEKNKFEKTIDNQMNGSSSPNNSLRTNTMLMPAERNNSKSPSPYYSACETPPLSNSNKFISTYESGKNNLNSKNNSTSINRPVSGEVSLRNNGIPSPTTWRRGSLQQREDDTLASSETRSYYNSNSGKLIHLGDQGFENRRCVSQSPRVDVQLVKSENDVKNLQSSPFVNDLHSKSPDKMKKFNLEETSPTRYTVTYGRNNNMSVKNNCDLTPLELAQEDFINDLQPVPLNPPKISIRGGVHEGQKSSKYSIPPRPASISSTGISTNSNKINPKVTENKISIEGIQLVIPSENKTSVGCNKTSRLLINPTEKSHQRAFSSPSAPSTSNINIIRTPSPQLSHSHEKSLHANDIKSSQSLYMTSSVEAADHQCKNTKTVVPRPRSSVNMNNASLEKLKETSPRPRSTMTHENCGDKSKVPSPCSYLNPEKHDSDVRIISQSSNPHLSLETNRSRLSSPQLSVTPDKSPVQEKCGNSLSNSINLMNTIESNSSEGHKIANTSGNLTRLSKPSDDDECADNTSKSLNRCSIVANQTGAETVSKEIFNESLLKNKNFNEVLSKSSGNSSSLDDTVSIFSPSLSIVSKEESSLCNLSFENEKDDHTKTVGSSLKIEKDLNQLLTEINAKQGEILSGKVKNDSSTGHVTSTDKRDSLALGKINPHKPVKLTTFSINDNDTIENNETIIVPNRENEIIGTSESMTDLLRELTRSLDQDFGCVKEKENNNKIVIDFGEKDIERTIYDTLEKDKLRNNSKSSDSQELNNTDEADNEVMEINRSVLEQSEIKESKTDVNNGNNENLIGFVAVKGNHNNTIGVKHDDFDQTRVNEVYDKSAVINEPEPTDVKDKQGYYSDDSNAEFVDEICKTASELSALSSTPNVISTSGTVSSQLISNDSTVNTPMMTDKIRQSRPQQSLGGSSDQNEEEEDSICGMVQIYNSVISNSDTTAMADDIKQQRMARYKEERRRQLAAQFGRRDVAISDVSDPAYGIRSTRASRLRSAATSAHNDSSLNSSAVNRYATKRDTGGLTGVRSPGSASSSFVTTSPDTAKEKSPPLVPSNNSVGIIATSTPRKERDKSSKRKSNLNRQLNAEEVAQPVTATTDDGVRRRRSRMVAPSLNSSGSSKSLSPRSSSTHLTTAVSRQTVESPKRLTPPRKLSERSVSSASTVSDNDHNSRVTPPVAASTTTPSSPSSRIPKKVASSPSLLSSSSRESSPRHKSSSHRLSVVSASHTLSQVNNELTSPSSISPTVITISNGPTNSSAIRGPATVISGNHINGHCSYNSNSKSDTAKVVEVNSLTNCNSASTITSDITLDSCVINSQTSSEQIQQPNSPRHIVRPVVGFKKKTSLIDDSSSHHMPVSILKRKTSQEEGSIGAGSASGTVSAPPPVTFSPSVVDPVPGRRQGILKKHRSLDEAEVTRRRSCSPDVESAEFRPILKHQRRSSLEELHRRTQSPEPQSILKRKTSREEGVETNSTSEPQGILKRKTSTSTVEDIQGHITIADTVLLAITGGVPTASEDHVKPILKKKSFSGEEAPSEIVNSSDTPRPILKKKASIEAEDVEEKHHMKPILKFRKDCNSGSAFVRVSSFRQDTKIDVTPNEDCIHVLLNTTDRESESSSSISSSNVVPILKKSESEPSGSVESGPSTSRFNKCVVWRNNMVVTTLDCVQDPHKRRSLDIVPTRDDCDIRPSRPLSVAERIMNMESFLASEGCSDSPSSASITGTLPKKMRDKDRFRTQPVTAQEISNSKSWVPEKKQNLQPEGDSLSVVKSEEQTISAVNERLSGSVAAESRVPDPGSSFVPFTRSDSVSAKASLFNQLEAQMKLAAEEARSRRLSKGSNRRIKADNQMRFVTQPVTVDELEEAKRQNETKDPSTQDDENKSNDKNDDADDENDPSKLSLAERVKLFNKKMVNDRLNMPVVTNRAVRSTRFKTQPVTTEEVSTAQEMNSVSSKISRTASGILVSGLLKNLAQKSGVKTSASSGALFSKTISDDEDEDDYDDNAKNSGDFSDSGSSDDSGKETSSKTRGILKQKSPVTTSARISKKDKQSEGLLHLKCVLKKESCDNNVQHPSDLHSILRSKNKNHKSSESRGDENSENNDNNVDENSKKSNKNLDIVNLLHKVEAEARSQPHSEDLGNLNNSASDQLMNLKNLANKSLHRRSRRKRDSSDTSEGDTSSSGGREIKKINNEAIARRRQATIARQAAERVKGSSVQGLSKSKSQSAVGREDAEMMVNGGGETSFVGGLRRCFTQPMPPSCDTVDEPITIAQRLAALQKSGQTDWMKRVSKLGVEDELPSVNITDAQKVLKQQITGNEVRQSASTPSSSPNGSSALAERLDQLQSSTHGWKKRVEPSDAVQFSVAGRMSSTTPITSPVIERKKKTPRPARFRSKNRSSKEVQSTPTSPEAEESNKSREFKRSISAPSGDEDSSLSPVEIDPDETFHGPRVSIPKEFDENFSEFFSSANCITKSVERIEIKDEDLELVVNESRQKLVLAKRVKVHRRHEASGNPLKLLAARKDLCTDYVEVRSDVAQRELRRLNVEKLSKNSPLAVEALAGLASKEDFTSISLRKANSSSATGSMLPYKDLMLLHIKGRRHVQTRLVKPHYTSVNQGDSYVLVTPHEVYHWMGEYSNVIERSRSSEVAQHIQQKKDLGCSTSNIITLDGSQSSNNHKKFWKLLGADDEIALSYTGTSAGHPDEDELYESALIDTNMMYYVEDEELAPVQKCWGSIPRIEILNPSKIIVFDFGTELYVWMGKNATMDKRKSALQLAEELWSNGYDYTECDICPVSAAEQQGSHSGLNGTEEKKGDRPSWGLMAKVTQHMETVLFREKFLDWPDFSRVIRTKRKSSRSSKPDTIVELKPCNAQELLDCIMPAADLQLEGNHLGRGRNYFDEESRRNYEVTTQSVNVWHIEEFSSTELPEDSRGQFYSDDSYVIRWLYNITVTGRELSGQPSKHGMVGRDRCAYFIWQGSGATLNDQGAAALITVELDSERGPQIRIPQGSESPAFLSLFDGTAVIHHGKRGQPRSSGNWRLYICRGEEPQEGILTEVSCSIRSLRSRASFLLVNVKTGQVYLWHGSKALSHTREVASCSVDKLTSGNMADFGLGSFDEISFDEVQEGSEPKEFFQGLGSSNRQLYISLLNSELSYEWTPQLFHLSSMMGQFNATPVIPPRCHPNLDTPFPYIQEDLYSARQPALFLLNSEDIVWLWQGWVPSDESYSSDTEDQDELSMNSISMNGNNIRWQAERRAAMSTALELWHLKHGKGSTPKVFLACAGLEPLEFTNLFPIWFDRDDIAEINIRDGRKPGELLNVEEELTRLTRSTYPVAQLLQRPLPEGVDPTRLEIYLSPQDFQELLGMTKEEFTELPAWKQTNLKKTSGLF